MNPKGIKFLFLEKRNKTPQIFFLSSVTIHNILYKNYITTVITQFAWLKF